MAKKNEMSIGDAIDAYLNKQGIKETALVQRIISDWEKIMGKAIRENTEHLWFRQGIFYIKMKDPVWKNELSMARTKIKDLLNKELGGKIIEEVRIK